MRLHSQWIVLVVLMFPIVGCGTSAPSNLSPTAETDPERHQRAIRETEEKVKRDQEAERSAFQNMNKTLPK